ncbi:MAG TPA: hypothetical protein PLS49_09850, partial [Candidatus Woesebacteria bacterium]|nr:hypothetical protein [Candidatus Woesebacteria bacterium]
MYLHTLSKLYNIEKSSNSVPSIAPIYNRLRYLYKHYKNRLTTWEVDFLVSVGNQLKQNIELTDRQQVKVKQLLK